MLFILLTTGEFVCSNFLPEKNEQMIVGGAFFVSVLIFGLYWDKKNAKKEKILELKDKANNVAGHLRSVFGNYFDSPLKSTSTFLQTIVREFKRDEISVLMENNFFNTEQCEELTNYFRDESN